MPNEKWVIMTIIATVLIGLVLGICIFKIAWNFVMVGVFGLPIITFWQAGAIAALIWIVGCWFGSGLGGNNNRNNR